MFCCSNCQCGYLSPRFSIGEISRAYHSYYTHIAPSDTLNLHPAGWKNIWLKLRNGYLAHQYGWKFPLKSSYGRFVIPCLPGRRKKCGSMVRHLNMPKLGGRLLDIGCGSGVFLRFANVGGWSVEGLEPDINAAQAAKTTGLVVRVGGLPETGYEDSCFDAVTLNHIIEHLHDPVGGMQEVFRILKPGGLVTVVTPNIESLSHKLYKRNWRGLEPPRHLVLFNGHALKAMSKIAGFEVLGLKRSPPIVHHFLWSSEEIARREKNQPSVKNIERYGLRIVAWLLNGVGRCWPRYEEEIVLLLKKPLKD